jgi:hypothetical protein
MAMARQARELAENGRCAATSHVSADDVADNPRMLW